MDIDLSGKTVAVLGGDERERILVRALCEARATVRLGGFPYSPEWSALPRFANAAEAVEGADAVIAPLAGADEQGVVYTAWPDQGPLYLNEETMRAFKPGAVLLIGVVRPIVERAAARCGVRLVRTADLDEIAILNSIPTAEGAIQRAMERLPVTIHGCRAVVVGFGRCGQTIGRALHVWGAQVSVAVRDRGQQARAREMGMRAAELEALGELVAEADVVFNTVPAQVLTFDVLRRARTQTLIIDIASAPGGTDFEAARSLGLAAHLEGSIPGRVAPVTAGRILAKTIPRILQEALGGDFRPVRSH